MAFFDDTISAIDEQFGLGGMAKEFLAYLLSLVVDSKTGGLGGFITRMKSTGLDSVASRMIGGHDRSPLTPDQVDKVLGHNTIQQIASRFGISEKIASSAAGFLLPRLIGNLTPDGKIPDIISGEVENFVRQYAVTGNISDRATYTTTPRPDITREPIARREATYEPAPRREAVQPRRESYHVMEDSDESNWFWWLIPLLGLALLGLFLGRSCSRVDTVEPVASSVRRTPPAEVQQPMQVWPRLGIARAADGTVRVSGVVADEASRRQILDALSSAFGDAVRSNIQVDARAQSSAWVSKFPELATLIASDPAAELTLDGSRVTVGGKLADADRIRLVDAIRRTLGSGFSFD